MNVPSTSSTESVLKRKTLEWWYFGPVLLAIVMFLLVGTIFERRIEAIWRRIIERGRARLAVQPDTADTPPEAPMTVATTNSLQTVKTPSQRTLASAKTASTSGDTVEHIVTRTKLTEEAITNVYSTIQNHTEDPTLS
ncbi:unnamed protein product [Chrysodeixis includens]|uniref:Uncharacterized protein n=1 Tax=Chrysodeixis includens TaxID=689277 RepID=A0A9P0BX96_CHRIL|nr:unnamed protein product [Chrysodeixis includens]